MKDENIHRSQVHCTHPAALPCKVLLHYSEHVGGPPCVYDKCKKCLVCGEIFIYTISLMKYLSVPKFENEFNLTVQEIKDAE